jgi:aryl-alcohol dehydrogenase-like predicted oxidoreductase
MRRRDLLKAGGLAWAATAGGFFVHARGDESGVRRPVSNAARIPVREYGKSGVKLSIIGFPGFGLRGMESMRIVRMVGEAVERGVNYFDVAPEYGNAEELLGPALEPYRKDVFLACKTGRRDAEGAAADLKKSFERLRTDHFDLYQLHHLGTEGDNVDRAFAKGGALEVLIQAKKEGRARFLGFSAHSEEAALTAMDRYDFDSVLYPINFASMLKGKWGLRIMARAREKGVAQLALKALARQKWPTGALRHPRYSNCWYQPLTDLDEAELGLRYTLSQPVVAAVTPASEFMFYPAMDLAMDFSPLKPEEEKTLSQLAEKLDPIFVRKG